MTKSQFGTIAQLVYADAQPLNFARVVGDLHSIMERFRGSELRFEWDCEDLAFFDLPDARIVLGWDDQPGKGYSACLTVSVGPPPTIPPQPGADGHEQMCSRLVERLQGRYPATAILWHQTEAHLTADLIDRLIDTLPPLMQLFPFEEPDWVAAAMARQSPGRAVALRGAESSPEAAGNPADAAAPASGTFAASSAAITAVLAAAVMSAFPATPAVAAPAWASASAPAKVRSAAPAKVSAVAPAKDSAVVIANDRPDLPRTRVGELARVRAALYAVDPEAAAVAERPSNQLRLAAHAMNATLIMVWPPLGAAVMTYSLLKGEDMQLSARLMVLTGLFATAIQSSMGQQMVAMAGI